MLKHKHKSKISSTDTDLPVTLQPSLYNIMYMTLNTLKYVSECNTIKLFSNLIIHRSILLQICPCTYVCVNVNICEQQKRIICSVRPSTSFSTNTDSSIFCCKPIPIRNRYVLWANVIQSDWRLMASDTALTDINGGGGRGLWSVVSSQTQQLSLYV